jgi:hypothetical protein
VVDFSRHVVRPRCCRVVALARIRGPPLVPRGPHGQTPRRTGVSRRGPSIDLWRSTIHESSGRHVLSSKAREGHRGPAPGHRGGRPRANRETRPLAPRAATGPGFGRSHRRSTEIGRGRNRRPHRGPSSHARTVLGSPIGERVRIPGPPLRQRRAWAVLRPLGSRSFRGAQPHHGKYRSPPLLAPLKPLRFRAPANRPILSRLGAALLLGPGGFTIAMNARVPRRSVGRPSGAPAAAPLAQRG